MKSTGGGAPGQTAVAGTMLARLTAGILFAALALGAVIPKVAGGAYLALALIGIIWLSVRGAWHRPRPVRHEKLLILVILAFAGVYLLSWAWHGFDLSDTAGLRRLLRVALIIPIYLFLRRVDGLEPAWWNGLTAAAWICGGYALWTLLTGDGGQRVEGPTNPIYFGGVTLIFGLMLLARVVDRSLGLPARLFAAAAVIMALMASALSGSRGAWLALFPLALLYVSTLGSREPPAVRFGVPAAAVAVTLAVGLMPFAPLGERMTEGVQEAISIVRGDDSERSVGQRTQMWRLAADDIRSYPAAGTGPSGFRKALEEAVENGRLDRRYLAYRHPHNQYLSALLLAGMPGLAVLLLLLAVPAVRYTNQWQGVIRGNRLLGWCGLVTVFVLGTMMLTESLFERNAGIVWFGLLVAGVSGLITARRRQELSAATGPRRQRLSVIIITKNEADRIERCLAPISGWADEIIVLDSGSADETVAICRRYTERVEVTDWPGFGKQKQRALDRARGDWVLSLDADEEVSEELKREIDLILTRRHAHFSAYRLPWTTIAFGRRLLFGAWSRAPLRLFLRGSARFTDAEVHEKLVLSAGRHAGRLEGPLYHRVFRDLDHAREKLGRYARLQAGVRRRRGRRVGPFGPAWRGAWNFVANFLLRGAFLDGRAGFTMSRLYARYTYDKYRRLRKHRTSATEGRPT